MFLQHRYVMLKQVEEGYDSWSSSSRQVCSSFGPTNECTSSFISVSQQSHADTTPTNGSTSKPKASSSTSSTGVEVAPSTLLAGGTTSPTGHSSSKAASISSTGVSSSEGTPSILLTGGSTGLPLSGGSTSKVTCSTWWLLFKSGSLYLFDKWFHF